MKIGFYGNANNYPFMLARALRRAGHDVRFLVASRQRLNRPENRYGDINLPYPSWIVDVSHPLRWHALLPSPGRARILHLLNGCDVALLNEEGPALAVGLRVPHVALLTGSDLQVFADPSRIEGVLPQTWQAGWLGRRLARRALSRILLRPLLLRRQRHGIATAQFISYFAAGLQPEGDELLAGLGISAQDPRRTFLYMTDLELLPFAARPSNSIPRLFCATRLTWKREADIGLTETDYKGTDLLLEGLARFARQTGRRFELHLVRKGRHLRETEALVAALGLGQAVVWHDEMSQNAVIAQYRCSDVVLDQMARSFPGMATLDAMAIGRPVIANGRPECFTPLYGCPLPVCHAETPEQVCRHLEILLGDPQRYDGIRLGARRFTEQHLSSDAAAHAVERRLSSIVRSDSP